MFCVVALWQEMQYFFFKFKSSNVVALGQILKCWIDVALVFLFHDALKGGNNIEIVNR